MEYELKNQMEILNFKIQQLIKKQDHQNQLIDFCLNTLNEEINKSTQQITQTEIDNLLCKIDNQQNTIIEVILHHLQHLNENIQKSNWEKNI